MLKRLPPSAVAPVEEFARRCPDFVFGATVPELVARMNDLVGEPLVDAAELERVVVARDRQVVSGLGKDAQVTAVAAARRFLTDRLVRVTKPHRMLDPAAGPLIAVRLSILTRKTLGGLHTDLDGRVFATRRRAAAGGVRGG